MSIDILKGKTANVHLWSPIDEVESVALDQLRNIASLPWVFRQYLSASSCAPFYQHNKLHAHTLHAS